MKNYFSVRNKNKYSLNNSCIFQIKDIQEQLINNNYHIKIRNLIRKTKLVFTAVFSKN